ncbi:DUF3299 domain-containing protein [Rapidithrix thailandica]|uniref:DUF3299 domain-containing protein n=1 Tax=Rapidithrix thailandica TaxID=413964 RepID=A0AAW9S4U3_9BACT
MHWFNSIPVFVWLLCFNTGFLQAQAQPENTWVIFSTVKFKPKYISSIDGYLLHPTFGSSIKKIEGKQIRLKGFVLPLDIGVSNMILLSKYPYRQCFFCGGAGPETVAEILFKSRQRKFAADEVITVEGRLKLNNTDIDHTNFIIEEAEIIKD